MSESYPELGFGIMRFPCVGGYIDVRKAEKVIEEYMKGKFCYFDVHPAYINGMSQNILRKLVVEKYPRESYQIANKMPYYGINEYEDYEKWFTSELVECGVEHFDFYLLHFITRNIYERHERSGGFKFLQRKKEEGKIEKIGFSFHDQPDVLERILEQHPEVDFVQLQINYLDWESPAICSKKCYEIARNYNKDIMVMEPIKGGSLTRELCIHESILTPATLAEASLAFVAQLPGIKVILSGMTEPEHVIENRKTIEKCKEDAYKNLYDYAQIVNCIRKSRLIQCTNCRYCTKECPQNIPIPDILSLLNSCRSHGKNDVTFRGRYAVQYKNLVTNSGRANECINCGKCEKFCPQKLKIREYIKESVEMFENIATEKNKYYSDKRNIQILIYLMKKHKIKKIVASPGTANMNFVYSVQQDGGFEIYSSVDERSAAYMACGLAEESGEAVALTCTGATASRNYLPGLTEAYYRKLPILAITAAQPEGRIGHNIPQMIDRRHPFNDVAKVSVNIPNIHDEEEEWACENKINETLLELNHRGSGPVHINLVSSDNDNFSVEVLPSARVIHRVVNNSNRFPAIPQTGMVGVFCGAHSKWKETLTQAVDKFCEKYNAVVLCDHTSNYTGKYGVLASLILSQENKLWLHRFELIIHIGNVSGAYMDIVAKNVWRVNPDGKICDTFRKLEYVFEMEETDFFERSVSMEWKDEEEQVALAENWQREYQRLAGKIGEMPFSNVWIASKTAGKLPENAVLHLGILNSLRSWNFFEVKKQVRIYANTGGFGIDGCVSSLIGASLSDPKKIYYGVIGDLAFFYDLNALGNRHLGKNVRLILINNGCGTEFKNYSNVTSQFGKLTDINIAAAGHYGNKSKTLVKAYAQSLGLEYMSASTKEEYLEILPKLTNPEPTDRSMLVEIFTDSEDESCALKIMKSLNGEKKQITLNNKREVTPNRIVKQDSAKQVVLWGTGYCFMKNLSKIEKYCHVQYVCDNNQAKWGREILPDIHCISPQELSAMRDIFVVIMVEDIKIAFSIANQLLDMNIQSFDIVHNWLNYADKKYFS